MRQNKSHAPDVHAQYADDDGDDEHYDAHDDDDVAWLPPLLRMHKALPLPL